MLYSKCLGKMKIGKSCNDNMREHRKNIKKAVAQNFENRLDVSSR